MVLRCFKTPLEIVAIGILVIITIQVKGEKPISLERISILQRLNSSEIESLREELKVSTEPKCLEALQETIITFLKGIRESDGIIIPRQDEDGDDGDDGDGAAGAAGGLFGGAGGAGGLFGDVMLPQVVPQVITALTDAFTGFNQVVNSTSGQNSLPSLLFSGFSNLVGQFTGNTPAPVTPPPYYPIPPGGSGGYQNRWPSGNFGQQSPNRPIQQQLLPQQPIQNIPVSQSPQRVRPQRVKPKPKPVPSEPPKAALWNIYKSFMPSAGSGSGELTDFQLAHPEGFHSELLSSILSSLSKIRGTTEKSSNSKNNYLNPSVSTGGESNSEPSSDIQPAFPSPQHNFEIHFGNNFGAPSNNQGQLSNQVATQQQQEPSGSGSSSEPSESGSSSEPSGSGSSSEPASDIQPAFPSPQQQNLGNINFGNNFEAPSNNQGQLSNQVASQQQQEPSGSGSNSEPASDIQPAFPSPQQQNLGNINFGNNFEAPSNQGQFTNQVSSQQLHTSTSIPNNEQTSANNVADEIGPPPKLVYNPEPSVRPSLVIQQAIPARITLPSALLPLSTSAPVQTQKENVKLEELTSTQAAVQELLSSPEPKPEEYSTNLPEEVGSIAPIQNIIEQTSPQVKLSPAATPAKVSIPERLRVKSTPRTTKQPRTLPPTRDWSARSTPPPEEELELEEIPEEPLPTSSATDISISIPNRLTNWITGNTNTPSSKGRPVIINNKYYPDIETALNAQQKYTTDKPKRRRRSTTTTVAPYPESDYYPDEDPAPKVLIKKVENLESNYYYEDEEDLPEISVPANPTKEVEEISLS